MFIVVMQNEKNNKCEEKLCSILDDENTTNAFKRKQKNILHVIKPKIYKMKHNCIE